MQNISSKLISQFKLFLLEKQEETGTEYNTDTISIYQYKEEFEEFIEEKYFDEADSIFSNGFNIDNMNKLKISEKGFETDDNSSKEAEFFAEMLNNLMESEEFKKAFDSDNDGTISNEEYSMLLDTMNSDKNETISINEFMQTLTDVKEKQLSIMDIASVEDTSQQSGRGSTSTSRDTQRPTGEKKPENMSLNELKGQLDTAKQKTDSSEASLSDIINDKKEDIAKKKAAAKEAFDVFSANLESKDETLSKDLKGKKAQVEEKQNLLNQTETAINTQQNLFTDANGAFSAASARLTELEGTKTSLEAELKTLNGEENQNKIQKIKEKISAIETDITAQKAIIAAEEAKKNAAEQELNRLNNEVKPQQLQDLETLKGELTELENRAGEIALAKNSDNEPQDPALAQSWNDYMTLQKDYETTKSTALASAKSEFETSLTEQNNIQNIITQKQQKDVANKYSLKGLNLSYTFKDGTEYDVVGIEGFDSLEDFTDQVYKTGLTNLGDYGAMQCFNYSVVMSDLILGRANEELTEAFVTSDGHQAGYMGQHKEWNFRDYHKAKSSEEGKNGYDIVANELSQGRPCVVGMNSSHYGLCVGMRSGAEPPYRESDFLIIDSYNAQIEQGGNTNYFNKNQSIYVLTDGWRYENGHGAFKYEF